MPQYATMPQGSQAYPCDRDDSQPPSQSPRALQGPGIHNCLPWLGWLACCALPCSSNNNSGGAAAAGRRRRPVVVAGKAGKTGPGQTKPRQGTTSKPARPRHPFRTNILNFFFGPKTAQKEPGGPWMALGLLWGPYFRIFFRYLFPFFPLWGPPIFPSILL